MENQATRSIGPARYWFVVVRGFVRLAALVGVMFVLAGRIDYWQAWAWGAINAAVGVVTAVHFRAQRDLIEERVKPGPGTKRWDKVFSIVYIPILMALLVVAALDAGRAQWSPPLPAVAYVAAYVVTVGSYCLALWAMWTNRFFSSVVRIQTDRGHYVVDQGPYRFIRHPGYAGAIPLVLASALVLGSLWALIPAGLVALLFIVRTALEDATLQRELPGYAEYAAKVRWRLVPGIW